MVGLNSNFGLALASRGELYCHALDLRGAWLQHSSFFAYFHGVFDKSFVGMQAHLERVRGGGMQGRIAGSPTPALLAGIGGSICPRTHSHIFKTLLGHGMPVSDDACLETTRSPSGCRVCILQVPESDAPRGIEPECKVQGCVGLVVLAEWARQILHPGWWCTLGIVSLSWGVLAHALGISLGRLAGKQACLLCLP